MVIRGAAGGIGRQRHQRGAKLLALIGQRVAGVGGDFGVESAHLLLQPAGNRIQKGLHRLHDTFPNHTGFVGSRAGRRRGRCLAAGCKHWRGI